MKTKRPALLKSWQKEAMRAEGKNLMQNLAQTPRYYNARSTVEMLSALLGPEREVLTQPRPITFEMGVYEARAQRILWERWECAAVALCNLRAELDLTDSPRLRRLNEKAINNLLRCFPNIDVLFPASLFEPEYEEEVYH